MVKDSDIRPQLGIRIKLTNTVSGKWAESSGDRSTFGLTIAQIMDVVERLRETGYLDCLPTAFASGQPNPEHHRDQKIGAGGLPVFCRITPRGRAVILS